MLAEANALAVRRTNITDHFGSAFLYGLLEFIATPLRYAAFIFFRALSPTLPGALSTR
jgi:hypothetical protein